MRIIRRLPGVLSTAVMVSCLVVTSVTAAPSQDSLEERNPRRKVKRKICRHS